MRSALLPAPLLLLMTIAAPARAGANEPTTQAGASEAFVVRPMPGTSKDNVIAQILEAGHDQLAAACAADPAASVRILNPLAADEHVDIACSTLLDGGESVAQSGAALTSTGDESLGETQQPLTPAGPLLCGLASLIATTAGATACSGWRGTNSQFCNVGNFASGAAWIFACALMF